MDFIMKTAAEVCAEIKKINQNKKDENINLIIDGLIINKGTLNFYDFWNNPDKVNYQWVLDEKNCLESLGFNLSFSTVFRPKFEERIVTKVAPAKKFLGFTVKSETQSTHSEIVSVQVEVKILTVKACCGETK